MSKGKRNNYFFYILFTLVLAIVAFLVLKNFLPERLFPENKHDASEKIAIDSLAIEAIADCNDDSIKVEENIPNEYLLSSNEKMEGYSNISRFYNKLRILESTKKSKVRIAYFSDSMTDGDLIVQDFRKKFQDRFGGKGVGFVGITSLSANARYSVSHRYSKNWETKSFLKGQKSKPDYGIDGQVSLTKNGSVYTLDLKANDMPHCEYLQRPTLFFGTSTNNNGYIHYQCDNDSVKNTLLTPVDLVNTLSLSDNNPKKVSLKFYNTESIPFYGLSFDSPSGVHVDNFSMRGNSGLPLSALNADLMQAFDSKLHYDLIILHYGANVIGYKTNKYDWYEKRMEEVANHLKKCFPNADILVISTADKGSKIDMVMQTDPAVEPLAIAQKYFAKNTNSTFINLYQLMGGKDSMVKWVEEEKPALANKDYTHFNSKGSKKIALMLYEELENGYNKYLNILESSKSEKRTNQLLTGGKVDTK
ncbi:hypothetical protein D0T53_06715 [Dysgonomonas sp. 216]|uniref:GDSL-type esterase/lipase family protein n=1 Tax=Dysgonomonas sp. 216 TaxID=2302934 RepID=UPI0013D30E88|nr:GDSL-type esterase/lipase family protein [Dysgonomonas sp. 216]NDW18607.1 hypothetical protein [Dysgonomonas sp. 216]